MLTPHEGCCLQLPWLVGYTVRALPTAAFRFVLLASCTTPRRAQPHEHPTQQQSKLMHGLCTPNEKVTSHPFHAQQDMILSFSIKYSYIIFDNLPYDKIYGKYKR